MKVAWKFPLLVVLTMESLSSRSRARSSQFRTPRLKILLMKLKMSLFHFPSL